MQTLSNVPFKDLRVGDRIKIKSTGQEGFISKINPTIINDEIVDPTSVTLFIQLDTVPRPSPFNGFFQHKDFLRTPRFCLGVNFVFTNTWLM